MRKVLSTVGCAVLVAAVGPAVAASGVANASAARAARGIGDTCLVGTWHDNGGQSSTIWNGEKVKMHGGAGDVDHIASDGTDHDFWAHSKPFYGTTSQGLRLKETIRGRNTFVFHKIKKGVLRVREEGWSAGSSNRYVYQGKHYTGYLNQSGTGRSYYRCSATTLKWLNKKGKLLATETRISRKP